MPSSRGTQSSHPQRLSRQCSSPAQLPLIYTSGSTFPTQVCVPPTSRFPHKTTKLKLWQKAVPAAGGWLTTTPGPDVTHLLVGSEAAEAAEAQQAQQQQQQQQHGAQRDGQQAQRPAHIVHYSWLEQCLLRRQRLPEAGFGPAAAAAAAAERAAAAAPPPDPPFVPAAQAEVMAIPAHVAFSGVELGSRSGKLKVADLTRLVMHLLAGGPRPHWLVLDKKVGDDSRRVTLRRSSLAGKVIW